MTDLFESAPRVTNERLRAHASTLHSRIAISITLSIENLCRVGYSIDDAKNVCVSAQISALAEIVVGMKVDPEHVMLMFREQVDKLEHPIVLGTITT